VPEFHAEAPQATVSERLAQGPYLAARAGVKPITLRTKGVDSTKAPPRLHNRLNVAVSSAAVQIVVLPMQGRR